MVIMSSKLKKKFIFPTACKSSYFQEGIGALWTGLGPNIARNAIINATELASYDQLKQVPFDSFTLYSCGHFLCVLLFITLFCLCRCF